MSMQSTIIRDYPASRPPKCWIKRTLKSKHKGCEHVHRFSNISNSMTTFVNVDDVDGFMKKTWKLWKTFTDVFEFVFNIRSALFSNFVERNESIKSTVERERHLLLRRHLLKKMGRKFDLHFIPQNWYTKHEGET